MLTPESVNAIEISQDLKDQITALLNTVQNQKTSFTELVEINNGCSKDNERLRSELETLRTSSEQAAIEHRETKTQLESANIKLQQIRARFGA